MCFVKRLMIAGEIFDHPTWEIVESRFLCLKDLIHRTLSLYGDANAQMMVEFVKGEGYFVSVFGKDEIEEWLAVDQSRPSEMILVDISGNLDDVPKNILVSDRIALSVVKHFFLHGVRSADYAWIKSIELTRG